MSSETDTDSSQQTAPPEPRRRSMIVVRLRGWWLRRRIRAFRRWPSVFPDPDLAEMRKYHREHDSSENDEATPDRTQHFSVRVIWVMELFPPSSAATLVDRLNRMEWSQARPFDPIDRWISTMRESLTSGAWATLGTIVRATDKRLFGIRLRGNLPREVDRGLADITILTSGLTCLRIGFVLTETAGDSLEARLHDRYATTFERSGLAYSIRSPRWRKQDAARDEMQLLRIACIDWIRDHFPGAFASKAFDHDHPTVVFGMTDGVAALDGSVRDSQLLRLLDLNHEFDAWTSSDMPGIRLCQGRWLHETDSSELLICGHRPLVMNADWLRERDGREEVLPELIHEVFRQVMSLHAANSMLSAYEKHIAKMRDALVPSTTSGATTSIRTLKRVQQAAVVRGFDLRVVTSELRDLSERKPWILSESPRFGAVEPKLFGETDFTERLMDRVINRIERLLDREAQLRELILLTTSTDQAATNLQLQIRITSLTWVLVALTILLTVLGVLTLVAAWPKGG
jgi:hypothetical protein